MPYAISYRNSQPVQIYYEDIGDPALPILVMQHGDGNSSQNWKSMGYVERLTPHFRLILIDTLGFGESEKIYDPAAYTMPLLASDTIAVLKHLQLNEPVHFFGGSMGGRIGFVLAGDPEFSQYFKTFIISSMGISAMDVVQEFAKWANMGGMPYVVEQMEKNFLEDPFPVAIRETFLKNDAKAFAAANTNPWPDVTPILPRIHRPTLLIAGETSAECSEPQEAVKLIKNAQLKILPGLNHVQTYWGGDKVAPVVIAFLNGNLR